MVMNIAGYCGKCRDYRDMRCLNPASPYGGKPRLPMNACWAYIAALDAKEPRT